MESSVIIFGGIAIKPWHPAPSESSRSAGPGSSSATAAPISWRAWLALTPALASPSPPYSALPSAARQAAPPVVTLGGLAVVPWQAPSPTEVVAARAVAAGGPMRRPPSAAATARRVADGPGLRFNSSTGRAVAEQAARGWVNPIRDRILAAINNPTSATQLGQVLQLERAVVAVSGQNLTAYRDYVRVCTLRHEEALPISAAKLLALAADYVGTRGNQARGVSSLITRVKGFAQTTGAWHLSHDDEDRLRKDASFVCGQFPYEVRAAAPITFVELDLALAWLRAQAVTLYTLQMAALMTVMHGGLLRGSEAADGHLLRCDAVRVMASDSEGRGGFKLALKWRKMAKHASDIRMDGTCIVARTEAKRCPVFALDAYLDAAKLAPQVPLFVTRDRVTGAVTDASGISYDAITKEVRFIFGKANVKSASTFTARGFRSGGHTDLYREAQDFELVGLLGGWRSVESQRLYLRLERLSFRHLSEVLV